MQTWLGGDNVQRSAIAGLIRLEVYTSHLPIEWEDSVVLVQAFHSTQADKRRT